MDIYSTNSNLKTYRNNRKYLEYNFLIGNSHSKPGTKSADNAIDRINDDELGTSVLDEKAIDEIVANVNKTGYPAIVKLTFKLNYQNKIDTIQFPILPSTIFSKIDDRRFMQEYVYYYDENNTRNLNDSKQFADIEYSNKLKEYIRRKLINIYLKCKQNQPNEYTSKVMEYIEGLNIVNNKYDLREIKRESITPLKFTSDEKISSAIEFENNNENKIKLISKYIQQDPDCKDKVYLLYEFGTHPLGLVKGKSLEEIEKIAENEKITAKTQYLLENNAMSIFDQYVHAKKHEMETLEPSL